MSDINLDELLSAGQKMEASRQTLVDLRRRIANGEAVPEAELKNGLRMIRECFGQELIDKAKEGKKASSKAGKARAKAAEKQANADDILAGLLKGL